MTPAIVAVPGSNPLTLAAALGLVNWVEYARVVRGEVLTLLEHEFVEAGLVIASTVLGILFLGDWLRDVLDPRLR